MKHRMTALAIAAAVAGAGLVACQQQQAATAPAATLTWKAHLTAKDEVPPNASTGTGDGTFTLNTATNELTWSVTFSGLTGPATVAHIHGPAAPGQNANPVVGFDPPKAAAGEIKGSNVILKSQVEDIKAGKWYANIHTAANKGGEIRGQLTP
ncbi:MAG TPA: CHRD domain-containing protein [Stellaceae bacterium]|nr:CHRD domain-containing protein [Stellaceae bacterium]